MGHSSKRNFGLICLLFLILRAELLVGKTWGNVGLTVLVRAMTVDSETAIEQSAEQAEVLLQRAAAFSPEDRSFWRWLGFSRALQGKEKQAISAWRKAGETSQTLIRWGEEARTAHLYQDALRWHQRAVQVQAGLGDPYYYLGLVYVDMALWQQALEAFQQAASLPLDHVGQSDACYYIGWLQFHRIEPPNPIAALAVLDQAISGDQFAWEANRIQARFRRGEVLYLLGRKKDALLDYEWVVDRQPEHYWARTNLGMLYWQVEQDAKRAETMLATAISLDPNAKWTYRILARVYRETGRQDEAIEMYKRVLAIDPQDEVALEQLEQLIPPENH